MRLYAGTYPGAYLYVPIPSWVWLGIYTLLGGCDRSIYNSVAYSPRIKRKRGQLPNKTLDSDPSRPFLPTAYGREHYSIFQRDTVRRFCCTILISLFFPGISSTRSPRCRIANISRIKSSGILQPPFLAVGVGFEPTQAAASTVLAKQPLYRSWVSHRIAQRNCTGPDNRSHFYGPWLISFRRRNELETVCRGAQKWLMHHSQAYTRVFPRCHLFCAVAFDTRYRNLFFVLGLGSAFICPCFSAF